jgi:class 3 adenylate cyclase
MLLLSAGVLLLPLAGLVLLILRPVLDIEWRHQPSHFWLVLITAVLSSVLAYATGAAALRRGDARVLLVSCAFLSAAGFLALHALATPGVLLQAPNAGFTIATPVGLSIGSVFAAASGRPLASPNVMRGGRWLRTGLLVIMAGWAVFSLAELPPLRRTFTDEEASAGLIAIGLPGIVLYGYATWRYLILWRHRRSLMLLSVLAANALLAEALIAVIFARSWHLSWWEWHLLMLLAFVLVAVGARLQWHEERFADLYTPGTTSGTREVSVLFADLQGMTGFSEQHRPQEVAAMLNAYFEVAVPQVVGRFGGTVDRIIGDALMVTFNRLGDQPDHARRAAGAALALQEATGRVADAHPDWPRFRVGVNTGPVAVGVLGTEGGRTVTMIGDTVNVAARIEGTAPVGGVAIGPATRAALPDAAVEPLGPRQLKGKAGVVEVYRLRALTDRE